MNIVDAVDRQARLQPNAVALLTPEMAIGYGEVVERVRRLATWLAARGVGSGDRVAVRLPNSPLHLLTVLSLARLGAAAVPLHPLRPADQVEELASRLRLTATVGLRDPDAIRGTHGLVLDDASMQHPIAAQARAQPNAPGGDCLAALGLTSGTSGRSKAIAWTHRRMLHHWALVQRLMPHGPGVRLLVFLGLDGNYPMQAALRMLFSGGTVVLTPDVKPASLADAIDRLGANDVVTSPALMSHVLDALPGEDLRFPGLARLCLGGSPVAPALMARFRQRLTPNIEVTYGSTEAGLLALGGGSRVRQTAHAVGALAPWVEAQVVDAQGHVLPRGEQGQLRFRSDAFATGYFEDDGRSANVFKEGWYVPGDVGRLLPDDILVVDGRADDVLNVGGTKVDPAEVEEVLLQDPTIADAAAYVVDRSGAMPRLVAAVVARAGFDESSSLRRCRATLGQKSPLRLVVVPALPRNSQGKVLRDVLVARTRLTAPPR